MTTREYTTTPDQTQSATRTLLGIGLMIGVGITGTLDEVVFHQLLQWHNFYVHTTQNWRIVSDGLFHIFSSLLLGFGAMRFWAKRQLLATLNDGRALAAGVLLGAGAFNLYDGTIQHKVLQLHPVREGVANILPYDLAWNGVAVVVLAAGLIIWRGVQRDRR